jgi:aquaporin Z
MMGLLQSLRHHWPEYLMEALGLGMFMISAGVVVVVMESTAFPMHDLIADADLRRAIIGIAMGITAIGIIYSPWGKQSGAHLNPSVTLSFFWLGKVATWDALFYIAAQFIGGMLGVLLMWNIFGDSFAQPPVNFVATVPGAGGYWLAFAAEMFISLALMLTVLFFMNLRGFEHMTGLAAGFLVALFITLESPLSGMSMNPARSFASAFPGGNWTYLWIYFSAPLIGMFTAVGIFRHFNLATVRMCAKLDHADDRRCIHCGYEPLSDSGNSR